MTVLPILRTYRADGLGGPGSMCDRSGWRWVQLDGPCWNSLVSLPETTTWLDILTLTGHAGVLVCLIVAFASRWRKWLKNNVEKWCDIIINTLATAMVGSILLGLFLQLLSNSNDHTAETVTDQLTKSLKAYESDKAIKLAWQNTMRDGCCCGVRGCQDFTDLGISVTPSCGSHEHENTVSRTNIADIGCLDFVLKNVQFNSMIITSLQYIIVIFSSFVLMTRCPAHGNVQVSVGEYDAQHLVGKLKSKELYRCIGSLQVKLVSIIWGCLILMAFNMCTFRNLTLLSCLKKYYDERECI